MKIKIIGNRTYSVAIVAILSVITAFISGTIETVPAIQSVVGSLLAIFMRAGIEGKVE